MKNIIFSSENSPFSVVIFLLYLNRRVFVMFKSRHSEMASNLKGKTLLLFLQRDVKPFDRVTCPSPAPAPRPPPLQTLLLFLQKDDRVNTTY